MKSEPEWSRINETKGSLLRLEIASDHPAFKALFDKLDEAAQQNIRPEGVDATLLLRIGNYSLMLSFDLVKGEVPTYRGPNDAEFIFEAGKLSGETIYMIYRNDIGADENGNAL